MLQSPLASKKEILGYQLIEQIGSGGFGEVWSATAPGGLKKALKIVFGYHDGQRAQAELKALDRVKELRHPFLLSLERIEVFEGQLVVVSELADKSMADLFNQYALKGETGIPRDEMLRYLRCAAEALDYLSDEHNLQHLDIKPENLLLVGSHVKVADFGLIKDLHQATQSLMSGMTPAYAAPELFDGRPVSNSDQYSLAIVFQEMITGLRPFPGNTPAQLAAQHMHGKPNLSLLPRSDQPIIAKALSKDPSLRFKNCRQLVDELSNQRRAVKKAVRRQTTALDRTDTEVKTQAVKVDSTPTRDVTAIISGKSLSCRVREIVVNDPPPSDGKPACLRPLLVLGVGATGSKVAQKVKEQLISRYSSMDNVPAIKVLAIDSDRNSLNELSRDKGIAGLTSSESIDTFLRKPEAYRKSTKSHLNWLSRRWIYNVPRSLQTEGLRPLGRLAFADHFDNICSRIQDAVREISKPENVAKSADMIDMDPGDLTPRVIIVSSVSGGIGSGMTLDLAYAARLILHECGLPNETITGILLHSTYQRNRDPGLAAANAFAFLTEMRHYVEKGFPGDSSIGMPEFEDAPPFDYTYFNELGNDLCQSEYEAKLSRVAEYILLSSTTLCASFFDDCRELESEIEHLSLRTFGLSVTGPEHSAAGKTAAQKVGKGLLRKWLSADLHGRAEPIEIANQQVENQGLKIEQIHQRIADQVERCESMHVSAAKQLVLSELDAAATDSPDSLQAALKKIGDQIYGLPANRSHNDPTDTHPYIELEDEIGLEAHQLAENLCQGILALMQGKSMKLGLARSVTLELAKLIKSFGDQVDQKRSIFADHEVKLLGFARSIPLAKAKSNPQTRHDLTQVIDEYFRQRLSAFIDRGTHTHFRVLRQSLDTLESTLKRLVDQVEMISKNFDYVDDLAGTPDDPTAIDMSSLVNESIESKMELQINETETRVFESLVQDYGSYLQALAEPTVWQDQLASEIRSHARLVLCEAYKKISLSSVISHNQIDTTQMMKWLSAKIFEAKPEIDNCGGATRMLIATPELSEDDLLTPIKQQFHFDGRSIAGTQGSFIICFEGEDICLANIAFRLLQARPDALELVKRIQTRSDVDWVTLNDLL